MIAYFIIGNTQNMSTLNLKTILEDHKETQKHNYKHFACNMLQQGDSYLPTKWFMLLDQKIHALQPDDSCFLPENL